MSKQTALPRWRGFNLEQIHSIRFLKDLPETDFQWISELGFDFIRLPLSYELWTKPGDPSVILEEKLESIDHAVRWSDKYGQHLSLNFHRAPGYCCGGPPEPFNLWKDEEALQLFRNHCAFFASRYKGISSKKLSINLINESPSPSEERMTRQDHERVIRAATAAIREIDPDRLIIADGMWGGRGEPTWELADLGIAQATRGYMPMGLTHYHASWGSESKMNFPVPVWPGALEMDYTPWTRQTLEDHYQKWADLASQGIGVHCGECGCFIHTPHDVFLRWFEDLLDVLTGFNIGYALWQFRGDFGILDSNRKDVDYEDYKGHKLDRKLLNLMQKY
jgi:endoglucanase